MSADPKVIEKPRKLRVIDVGQLAELADLGVKFIHQKSLQYKDPKINAVITTCSRGGLDEEGTLLIGCFPKALVVLNNPSKAMKITVTGKNLSQEVGVIKDIMQTLSDHKVTPLGMTVTKQSITIFTSEIESKELLESLHVIALTLEQGAIAFQRNLALVRVDGVGSKERLETTSKLLESLQREGISPAGFLSTNLGVLFFVDWNVKERVADLFTSVIRETCVPKEFDRGDSAPLTQVILETGFSGERNKR